MCLRGYFRACAIPVLCRILRLKIRNSWRMRTTTPAVDTRPSFFAFRLIRRASVVANILREKFGPGDEHEVDTH